MQPLLKTLVYDGTFDGLLTAVFEVYEYKFPQVKIIPAADYNVEDIFAEKQDVRTNSEKSSRVLKMLEKNLGRRGITQLLWVFLSEIPDRERLVLSAIRQSIAAPERDVLQNFGDADILEISKIVKSVGREKHRMTAFVRFEKLQDGSFFARIEPDFNVLPLVANHFRQRYQDQRWLIFDLRRGFGIMWDLQELNTFVPENPDISHFRSAENLHHAEEKAYQKMWQRYFVKTGIPARKNLKLHTQWMPRRYWKYLTEKL